MSNIALFSYDKFNSEIFKIKMYNLHEHQITSIELLNQSLNELNGLNCEHISIKVSTSNKQLIFDLMKNGFYLTDTLVTYEFDARKKELPDINYTCEYSSLENQDIHILRRIAKESFRIDRFHSDPALSSEAADMYYEEWFVNSANGYADFVTVAKCDNIPVAFTTAKEPDELGVASLVLSAVDVKYRGKGIYNGMIHYSVNWALHHGAKIVRVGTQIDNYAVQKSWIKLGFSIVSSQYVFHKGAK